MLNLLKDKNIRILILIDIMVGVIFCLFDRNGIIVNISEGYS